MIGKCKWFNNARGYGFITRINQDASKGDDYLVYYTNIQMSGFKTLLPNQAVSFDPVETERGLSAVNVKPL